jgi:hypothetical protein
LYRFTQSSKDSGVAFFFWAIASLRFVAHDSKSGADERDDGGLLRRIGLSTEEPAAIF